MAYNSTIDKATDDILIYANTVKDGSGTSYVPLVDADGHLQVDILSGSSGTQYTEGDTDASISGTAIMWEDTGDTLRSASVANPLPVQIAGIVTNDNGRTQIVDVGGSVRANVIDLSTYNALAVAIVDGNGDQITSFGGGTQYTEDAVAATDPVGTMGMMVRADSLAAVTTTDGDNIAMRGTNKGELYVKHADTIPVTDNGGSLTVDNSGTFAVQAAQSGTWNITNVSGTVSLPTGASTLAEQQTQTTHLATIAGDTTNIETAVQLIDDVVYTDDTSTHSTGSSKGVLMMAAAVPTDTAVNANDIGAVGMTANRELYVSLMTALPAGTNGIGKLTANSGVDIGDVDVTSVTPGTTASSLGKAEDAIHNTGDVGVMALAVSNEANTARAADGDYLPIATDTEGNVRVVGNRDHDAVDAGEVVGVGGRAIAHGANPTAVAAADRTAWYFNRAGVPFVMGGHPNIVNKHIQVTDADGAQTDVALVTVGAGSKIIVTRYSVTVDSATTATGGVAVRMGFGTANTPSNDANSGMLMAHSGIPAGGGIAEGDGSGIIGMGADNEDLRLTCEDPTGGNIDIVVSYYTIES